MRIIPNNKLTIILLYLENMSNIMKTKLKAVNKNEKFCQLKVPFKRTNKLKNYFRFKDPVPETYVLIEFTNFRADAAKLLTKVKPTGI